MRLLYALVLWVLMIFMVVPPDFNYGLLDFSVTSGGIMGPTVLSLTLLAGVLACLSRWGLLVALLRRVNVFFIGFLVLATLSLLWSADPGATLRRLFRLFSITLGALSVALVGWHPRRFQNVVRPALTAIALASIAFVLLAPDLAIESANYGGAVILKELVGAWRGITMQKNALGAVAATATVLWAHAAISRQANILSVLVGLSASVACLVGSRSSTSIFAAAFAVLFMLLILRPPSPGLRRYVPYFTGIFATVIMIYSLAVLNIVPGLGTLLEPVTLLTGKDMSFSGRTIIWDIIREEITKHPVLGIGYAAYWTGPVPTSASYTFVQRTYVYPTESHNGYLDVVNELGFVGGLFLVGYLVVFLRQSLRLMKIDRYQGGLYLGLLFQEFIGNLSEAHWWTVASGHFLVMTMATFAMARALLQADLAAAAPGAAAVPAAPAGPAWRRMAHVRRQ
jgi:O-antigen ligase